MSFDDYVPPTWYTGFVILRCCPTKQVRNLWIARIPNGIRGSSLWLAWIWVPADPSGCYHLSRSGVFPSSRMPQGQVGSQRVDGCNNWMKHRNDEKDLLEIRCLSTVVKHRQYTNWGCGRFPRRRVGQVPDTHRVVQHPISPILVAWQVPFDILPGTWIFCDRQRSKILSPWMISTANNDGPRYISNSDPDLPLSVCWLEE